jgi:hypothetical protein
MAEIEGLGPVIQRIMGQVGGTVYNRRTKKGYVARPIYLEKAPTEAQKEWRLKYNIVDSFWGQLTEEEKNEWKKITHGKGHTRYSTYMKHNLKRIKAGLPLKKTP